MWAEWQAFSFNHRTYYIYFWKDSNSANVTAECCLNWKCPLAFEGHLALPYILFPKAVSSHLRIHPGLSSWGLQADTTKEEGPIFPATLNVLLKCRTPFFCQSFSKWKANIYFVTCKKSKHFDEKERWVMLNKGSVWVLFLFCCFVLLWEFSHSLSGTYVDFKVSLL